MTIYLGRTAPADRHRARRATGAPRVPTDIPGLLTGPRGYFRSVADAVSLFISEAGQTLQGTVTNSGGHQVIGMQIAKPTLEANNQTVVESQGVT